MNKPTLMLSLLFLCLSVSCTSDSISSSRDLNTTLDINTNKEVFTSADTVTVSFINATKVDVMLISDGCSAIEGPLPNLSIEKQEGSSWEDVTSHGCVGLAQPPVKIKSGQIYSISFRVGIIQPPLAEGTYRYRFDLRFVKGDDEPGEKLSERNRYSNKFKVVES